MRLGQKESGAPLACPWDGQAGSCPVALADATISPLATLAVSFCVERPARVVGLSGKNNILVHLRAC